MNTQNNKRHVKDTFVFTTQSSRRSNTWCSHRAFLPPPTEECESKMRKQPRETIQYIHMFVYKYLVIQWFPKYQKNLIIWYGAHCWTWWIEINDKYIFIFILYLKYYTICIYDWTQLSFNISFSENNNSSMFISIPLLDVWQSIRVLEPPTVQFATVTFIIHNIEMENSHSQVEIVILPPGKF